MRDLDRLGETLRDNSAPAAARLRKLAYLSVNNGTVTVQGTGETPQALDLPALDPALDNETDPWVLIQGTNPWLVLGVEAEHAGNTPRGCLAKAKRTTSLAFTSEVDVVTLPAVTLRSGRRYRLSLSWKGISDSTGSSNNVLRIKEGSTTYGEWNVIAANTTPDGGGSGFVVLDCVNGSNDISAGAHTFKATVARATGTGTPTLSASATAPATLLLADIGNATV